MTRRAVASGVGRVLNWDVLVAAFEPYTRRHTAGELKQMIEAAGGVCVICSTYSTLFDDPQVATLDMQQTLTHPTAGEVTMLGPPWNLERTPGSIRTAAPLLGQHTTQILGKDMDHGAGKRAWASEHRRGRRDTAGETP